MTTVLYDPIVLRPQRRGSLRFGVPPCPRSSDLVGGDLLSQLGHEGAHEVQVVLRGEHGEQRLLDAVQVRVRVRVRVRVTLE